MIMFLKNMEGIRWVELWIQESWEQWYDTTLHQTAAIDPFRDNNFSFFLHFLDEKSV
jgi:hypothetical protein